MSISLKCRCGKLRGVVEGTPGGRIICLCDDCQAYAHFLGPATEILDANGGTDISPVAPASLKITSGKESLKCVRLGPKGLLRWYAGCCRTPIANTMPSPAWPYAGVVHTIMDHAGDGVTRESAGGPFWGRLFGKYGIGPLPPGTHEKASFGMILRTIRFLLRTRLTGQGKPSPFFDPTTGVPAVTPEILTRPEREALRPLCGPRAA